MVDGPPGGVPAMPVYDIDTESGMFLRPAGGGGAPPPWRRLRWLARPSSWSRR